VDRSSDSDTFLVGLAAFNWGQCVDLDGDLLNDDRLLYDNRLDDLDGLSHHSDRLLENLLRYVRNSSIRCDLVGSHVVLDGLTGHHETEELRVDEGNDGHGLSGIGVFLTAVAAGVIELSVNVKEVFVGHVSSIKDTRLETSHHGNFGLTFNSRDHFCLGLVVKGSEVDFEHMFPFILKRFRPFAAILSQVGRDSAYVTATVLLSRDAHILVH